jgi:hypothetical protein
MDKKDDRAPLRVRYEYEKDEQASLQYAHGVWGGINLQGEIELNFYTESDKMPSFFERMIAPDGSLGHEIDPYDENMKVIVRRIHSRILLNYHTAKTLQDWLAEKVDALESESESAQMFFDEGSGMEQ